MNEVDSGKIQEEIKKLAEEKASGMTGFQEKFKVCIHITFSDKTKEYRMAKVISKN
jgi:hypothetical protein